jgi:PKD domain-containing protein/peptidase M28-like protein
MRRAMLSIFPLLVLIACLLVPAAALAAPNPPPAAALPLAASDFPTVDPNYIYDQLAAMATGFQHREAGYDDNLPASQNGHDEFAAYWTREITANLQGFGPATRRDPFPVQGWSGRPATVQAFNMEVSVTGLTHPEQVVVIGCHYDGEAISTQSAYDDASGCAIELGVAKALGAYWRAHHVFPARTLRFVIFDAEEQGLFGSFHYLNSTINGDLSNIVAMFNEEQNGIAYPLRFLSKTANPLLPFFAYMTPLTSNQLYPTLSSLPDAQKARITRFRDLLQQAPAPVFAQFQALGFVTLAYRDDGGKTVTQPVFAPDQTNNVQLADDSLGSSDQMPFTLAGLPCVTFVGNSTYYDRNPPPWSYPYDRPQDTIQLMNTYASGRAEESPALALALALPGMLTTWMLHQPDVLGEAPGDGKPLAAMGDIGTAQPGTPLSFDADAAFDPSGGTLAYAWSFGDGTSATGATVSHTYAAAGDYTITLRVTASGGTRAMSKVLHVTAQAPSVSNPYARFVSNGNPPENRAVQLPAPEDSSAQQPTQTGKVASGRSGDAASLGVMVGAAAVLVLIGLGAWFFWLRRKRAA